MPFGKLPIFSLKSIVQDMLYAHSPNEFIDFFCVGSRTTTPHLCSIEARWRFPWHSALFTLALIILVLTFMLAEYWARIGLGNVKLFLGALMVGTLAVPLGLASLFAEMNLWRNVTWIRLLMVGSIGGGMALILALLLFVFNLSDSPFSVGFIEEPSKVLIALLLAGKSGRNGYILNGMLFGAAVGAGFAVFESMGYAYEALFVVVNHSSAVVVDYQSSLSVMAGRSIFSLTAGHVTWTAITSASLWYCMSKSKSIKALLHPVFLLCLCAAAVIHGYWNVSSTVGNIVYLMPLFAILTWGFIASFYHLGIVQIREKQDDWLAEHGWDACQFKFDSRDSKLQDCYSARELIRKMRELPAPDDVTCLVLGNNMQRVPLSRLSFLRSCESSLFKRYWYEGSPLSWLRTTQLLVLGSFISLMLFFLYPAIGIAGYVFTSTTITVMLIQMLVNIWMGLHLPHAAHDEFGELHLSQMNLFFWLRYFIPFYNIYWGYDVATRVVRCINYGRKRTMCIPLWIPRLYWSSFVVTIALCIIIYVGDAYSFSIYAVFFILFYPVSAFLMALALMSADEMHHQV